MCIIVVGKSAVQREKTDSSITVQTCQYKVYYGIICGGGGDGLSILLRVAHLAKVYFWRYGGAAVYNPRRIKYFYCRTHGVFLVSVHRLWESACFNIILQDVFNIIYFYNTSIFYIIYYRIIYCSITYAMCVYTTVRARGGGSDRIVFFAMNRRREIKIVSGSLRRDVGRRRRQRR